MRQTLYKPVRIGGLFLSGNIFLAPVAGYSDRPFRSICTECGADFTYTEMVSSEALVRNSEKTDALIARAENEKAYAVQIFGSNPEFMAKTAVIIAEKYSPECIDINSGCPMAKITKTGAGSALMNDIPLLYKIVKAVSNAMEPYKIPVTLKIRSGFTCENLNWKEAAQAAIEAGAKLLTIHPRTRTQVYSGKADWNLIAELTQFAAAYKIPVFGSGDLFSPEDAKAMLETTGCAGVMFARGAMGNPFIFTQTKKLLTEGSYTEIAFEEKLKTGFKELLLLCNEKGEERGCREMRKRFSAYTKGIPNGSQLREKLVTANSIREYKEILQ
ncbi:tRNA dihydrouridine synthase DusB [Treponema pedis]|uniref:tRNA dihydrouridine synthase DusB n=2 Tax=Treponema pedis TaxID=409322 RepID=UPI00041F0F68|nr:tRNA dihydrouridine synthase DusB [Treponema pedis]